VALAILAVAQSDKILLVGVAGVLVVSLLFAGRIFNCWLPGTSLGKQLAGTFCLDSLFAPVAAPCTDYLRRSYEKNMADSRNIFPLPALRGGVDLYSYEQTSLFANGLLYKPRPVIQSYSAYTPCLAEMNAAHLRGPQAAKHIAFAVETIDGRFPTLDDGLSWPELLTRYDLNGAVDLGENFVLLSRAAVPRKFQLTPLQNVFARFGQPISLPPMTNSLLWAKIEIKKSVTGGAVTMFYKPPSLRLTVRLKNRPPQNFRLIPGLAASGFLLSPLIADTKSFAALARANGQPGLAGLEVESITISADTESGSTVCYESPMAIRFYRLDFSMPALR
jgi:hypothetical protein